MLTLMFTDDITSTLDNVGKKQQRERATPAGFSALTTKIFPLLKLSLGDMHKISPRPRVPVSVSSNYL